MEDLSLPPLICRGDAYISAYVCSVAVSAGAQARRMPSKLAQEVLRAGREPAERCSDLFTSVAGIRFDVIRNHDVS